VQTLNENILIGPYPHFDELERLHNKAGVDVVVSLLNVSLPQENALFNREKLIADKIGVKLYSYPMTYLKFRSEQNRIAADNLIALINHSKNKKIYIHCYLGRHRVKYIKEKLFEAGLISNKF